MLDQPRNRLKESRVQNSFSSLHWSLALMESSRIRRIKFKDTESPCMRCTTRGRTREGCMPPPSRKQMAGYSKYKVPKESLLASSTTLSSLDRSIAPDDQTLPSSSPPVLRLLSHSVDKDESWSLNYYRVRVSSDISGYFDVEFWKRHVVQASEQEPAVRHAVVALSSLYEAYETSQLPQRSSHDRRKYLKRIAILQYNKAIISLSDKIDTGGPSLEVTLIVCLIFTWLEFLQGCTSNALAHLHSGVQVLLGQRQQAISQDIVKRVAEILGRLLIQATLHGSITEDIDYTAVVGCTPASGVIELSSLEEARCVIDGKINSILSFHRRIRGTGAAQSCQTFNLFPDPSSLECEYRTHINGLEEWNKAFENLKSSLAVSLLTRDTLQALYQLELCYLRISNLLKTLFTTTPMIFDKYNGEYARMVYLSRRILHGQILRRSNTLLVLPFDVSVQGALFYVVSRCRHLPTRQEALKLLHLCPDYEGIWQRASLIGYCKWKIAIEEEGRPKGALESDLLPEHARVYDERVSEAIINGRRRTLMSFKRGLLNSFCTIAHDETAVTNLSLALAGLLRA